MVFKFFLLFHEYLANLGKYLADLKFLICTQLYRPWSIILIKRKS